jgi:hypothetical protein
MNIPDEIFLQVIEEVFLLHNILTNSFLYLRNLCTKFDDFILLLVYRNPFRFIKDTRLLICLYLYNISEEDNIDFLIENNVDVQILTQVYLIEKKITDDKSVNRFKAFSTKMIGNLRYLNEFDHYKFICSFSHLCSSSIGDTLNRFGLDSRLRMDLTLKFLLQQLLIIHDIELFSLNLVINTSGEKNERLLWLYQSVEDINYNLSKVSKVKLSIDFLDSSVVKIISRLNQLEIVCMKFYINCCFYFISANFNIMITITYQVRS